DCSLRLVVRVLQDVVRREQFDRISDVAEALKTRCARLRIPYDSGLVSAAIDQVERGGQLPICPLPAARRWLKTERLGDGPPPLTRDEAATIMAEIRRRV